MENNLEQQESMEMRTKVLSPKELEDLIYQGTGTVQDSRFLPDKEGGAFRYFLLENVIGNILNEDSEYVFPVIMEGDKIVGISELQRNPDNHRIFWIKFISIDPEYQGQGNASKLAEEIFSFAKQGGYILEGSSYNEDGYKKLKPVLNRLAIQYSVNFIDKGKF
jgi:GNAT superfamily N-acetyltransferase